MHTCAHVRMHITVVHGPAKMKRIQQSVIADFFSGSQSDSHSATKKKRPSHSLHAEVRW